MNAGWSIMAWREILAQVMEGFEVQENVSPEWLVNPTTGRRLKLDLLYPEAGLAVRFVGLSARGQRRKSNQEIVEEEQRDWVRAELCRRHGLELFLLAADHADPRRQLQQLRTLLSRLSRQVAQGERPPEEKADLMPRLAQARQRLDAVLRRVHGPKDLAVFADLWRDRQAALLAASRQALEQRRSSQARVPRYEIGQAVRHIRFGPGRVTALEGRNGELHVRVRFQDGSERTFLASLATDKLMSA